MLQKTFGRSSYVPRKGVYCPTNAIYWLISAKPLDKTLRMVTNLADTGKKRVHSVTQSVESRFVYPLIRGRDVSRWHWKTELSIILPQKLDDPSKAVPLGELKGKFPKTFAYFRQFEKEIRACALLAQFFDPETDPFYSSYNVGDYTLKPLKVAWKEICPEIEASVIKSKDLTYIPDHKLVFVAFDTDQPAYYLCAVLNSSPIRLLVRSYAISGSISGHIMEYANIPTFDDQDPLHVSLACLGEQAHGIVTANKSGTLAGVEAEIDKAVGSLWRITGTEMKVIRDMLVKSNNESDATPKHASRRKKGPE